MGRGLPLPYPALENPSSSKILDLPLCSMFLNSQTLGCSWETLLGVGFGFGFGVGFGSSVGVGVHIFPGRANF